MYALQSFQTNTRQFQQTRVSRTRTNGPLQISANKKVKKTQEVTQLRSDIVWYVVAKCRHQCMLTGSRLLQHPSLLSCVVLLAQARYRKAYQAVSSHMVLQVVVTQRGAKRGMGTVGELTRVSTGYFRNYLHPQKLALPATDATYA